MILDEFGKPVRKANTFITPESFGRELIHVLRSDTEAMREWDAQFRVAALYESAGVDRDQRVGATVQVRVPERFLVRKDGAGE